MLDPQERTGRDLFFMPDAKIYVLIVYAQISLQITGTDWCRNPLYGHNF
jgi:hypothetical protein